MWQRKITVIIVNFLESLTLRASLLDSRQISTKYRQFQFFII